MPRLSTLALAAAGAAAAPCDIYEAAETPCVAAHSVVRALYQGFTGPLYQVQRASDGAKLDVAALPNGFANAAAQDAFCAGSGCTIETIYDQGPWANHLTLAPPGSAAPHYDAGVNATRLPLTISGNKVYAAYFEGGQGYRNDATQFVAKGNMPQTIYMVTSGTHYNGGCCFDYGNAESNNVASADGSMEAVYFGNSTEWGKGGGNGPWVMADLENGLWAGNTKGNPNNPSMTFDYVTAMVKGGTNSFALKGGNAQSGGLMTLYDGPRPNGYQPMKKQGAIILAVGGDNSDWAVGTFFEGLIAMGYTSDAADAAVQADIVAAGYGK